MSTATAVLAVLAFLGFLGAAACRQLRAAGRQTDRIIRETLDGADLAAQVDDLELLWDVPAYQQPDPDLDAGCDRLWDAIRDEQQQGGTD